MLVQTVIVPSPSDVHVIAVTVSCHITARRTPPFQEFAEPIRVFIYPKYVIQNF